MRNISKTSLKFLKTKLDEAVKDNFELKIQLESKMSKTEIFKSSTGSDAGDQRDSELGECYKSVMDFFGTKTESTKIDLLEKSPSKIGRAESEPDTKPTFTSSNGAKNSKISLSVKASPESSQNSNKKRKRKKSGKTAAINEKSKVKPLKIWGLSEAENLPKPGTAISGLKI